MNLYDYNNHITRQIYIAICPNNYITVVRKGTLLFDEAKGTLLWLGLPYSYPSEDCMGSSIGKLNTKFLCELG